MWMLTFWLLILTFLQHCLSVFSVTNPDPESVSFSVLDKCIYIPLTFSNFLTLQPQTFCDGATQNSTLYVVWFSLTGVHRSTPARRYRGAFFRWDHSIVHMYQITLHLFFPRLIYICWRIGVSAQMTAYLCISFSLFA